MRVRAALSLINQMLDEDLSQHEGDVRADTRCGGGVVQTVRVRERTVRDGGDPV